MSNQRLIHDAAVAMSQALLDLMQPGLPYKERLKAIGEFYCICKPGLSSVEIMNKRAISRLNPTKN
jgi:hypothetical protein